MCICLDVGLSAWSREKGFNSALKPFGGVGNDEK